MSQPKPETALSVLEQNKPTLEVLALAYMPDDATPKQAQKKITREIANVEHWLRMKPDLAGICEKAPGQESMVYALKQCIQDGLTLAPSADLVYLIPGTVTTKEGKVWVINYEPTANGLLSMARQSGRILDHKRPTCEYDDTGLVVSVSVEFLVPSSPSPRWEKITFGPGHFKKWQTASANKNGGTANANYTSFNGGIDPEFAGTKAIIHGLNKRGMNMGEVAQSGGSGNSEPIAMRTELVPDPAPAPEPEYHQFEEVKNPDPQPNINQSTPNVDAIGDLV